MISIEDVDLDTIPVSAIFFTDYGGKQNAQKIKQRMMVLVLILLMVGGTSFAALAWSWSSTISLHLPRWGGISYDTNIGKNPDQSSKTASFQLTEGGQILKPLSAIIRQNREVISEWSKMSLGSITYSPKNDTVFAPNVTYYSAARSYNAEPNSVTIKYKFIPQDARE